MIIRGKFVVIRVQLKLLKPASVFFLILGAYLLYRLRRDAKSSLDSHSFLAPHLQQIELIRPLDDSSETHTIKYSW